MAFAIQPDGTITVDTIEEALQVRAALLQRAGASKGGANRWKGLSPEHRKKLAASSAASSRAHFAQNPGKGCITEIGRKFRLMIYVEGKARWAGLWPTRAAAEDAQQQVLDARRAGRPLPDFVRPRRGQPSAAENRDASAVGGGEGNDAPTAAPAPESTLPAPPAAAVTGAPARAAEAPTAESGEAVSAKPAGGDEVAGASINPSEIGQAPVPGESEDLAHETAERGDEGAGAASTPAPAHGEPAPSRWLTKTALAFQLPPGPLPKGEASRRVSAGMTAYWARKKAAAAPPPPPAPRTEAQKRSSAGSVAYWARWRAEHGKPLKAAAAPAPRPLAPPVVRPKRPLPPRCVRCIQVGHVETDCPKAAARPVITIDLEDEGTPTANLATCPKSQTDPSCLTDDDEGTDFTDLVDVPDAESTTLPDVNLGVECHACGRRGHKMDSRECPLSTEPEPLPPAAGPHLRILPADPETRIRAKSMPIPARRRLPLAEREQLVDYPDDIARPATRGECLGAPRPCPFVSCSHHLYLDVHPESGTLKLNFPHLEVWEMTESCSLDVADRGGITLEEIGAILNLTRERARQLEVRGMEQMREHGRELGEGRASAP